MGNPSLGITNLLSVAIHPLVPLRPTQRIALLNFQQITHFGVIALRLSVRLLTQDFFTVYSSYGCSGIQRE